MIISFDFDSTLATRKVQQLVHVLDRTKVKVLIITSRSSATDNRDLFELAEALGIHHKNIWMTDGAYKAHTCQQLGVDIHFDDMPDEIAKIQELCSKTLGVLVTTNIFVDMDYLQSEFPLSLQNKQQFNAEFE